MTILDRYIFRQVTVASLAAVGVVAFVFVLANVVKDLLAPVAAGRLPLDTFVELVGLIVASIVSFALPMGILTGILLVLGRLSSQQEITAMRAAGWGIWRIARPILLFAVLGMAATLYFNLELGPRSKTIYKDILAKAVETDPQSLVVERQFVDLGGTPRRMFWVGSKQDERLRDVWYWELDEASRARAVVHAREGKVRFDREKESLVFSLPDGFGEKRDTKDPEDFSGHDAQYALPILKASGEFVLPLTSLFGKKTTHRKLSLMTYRELRTELERAETNADNLAPSDRFKRSVLVRYAMQKSFVTALAVLAFAVVGVPLGIKMQRSESSANLGLALLLSLTFYLALILIDLLQKQPAWRPDLWLWLPVVAFGSIGAWLFRRVEQR